MIPNGYEGMADSDLLEEARALADTGEGETGRALSEVLRRWHPTPAEQHAQWLAAVVRPRIAEACGVLADDVDWEGVQAPGSGAVRDVLRIAAEELQRSLPQHDEVRVLREALRHSIGLLEQERGHHLLPSELDAAASVYIAGARQRLQGMVAT